MGARQEVLASTILVIIIHIQVGRTVGVRQGIETHNDVAVVAGIDRKLHIIPISGRERIVSQVTPGFPGIPRIPSRYNLTV